VRATADKALSLFNRLSRIKHLLMDIDSFSRPAFQHALYFVSQSTLAELLSGKALFKTPLSPASCSLSHWKPRTTQIPDTFGSLSLRDSSIPYQRVLSPTKFLLGSGPWTQIQMAGKVLATGSGSSPIISAPLSGSLAMADPKEISLLRTLFKDLPASHDARQVWFFDTYLVLSTKILDFRSPGELVPGF
jgi:hypothetical protein